MTGFYHTMVKFNTNLEVAVKSFDFINEAWRGVGHQNLAWVYSFQSNQLKTIFF